MKQTPPLLRIGTIAFFALMISGAVLYQCGLFEKKELIPETYEQPSESDYFRYRKAEMCPWYDYAAFVKEYGLEDQYRLSSVKSGPALSHFPRHFIEMQFVYDLLEMRYEVTRLSGDKPAIFARSFHQIHAIPKVRFAKELPIDKQDSVDALLYTKVGAANLPRLSAREHRRFEQLLNKRLDWDPQQKAGALFDIQDTIKVLRALKRERNPNMPDSPGYFFYRRNFFSFW